MLTSCSASSVNISFLLSCSRNFLHWNRATCGASDELRDILHRSPQGIDKVVSWWQDFKELRRIVQRSHASIERCVLSVLETQGRDALALHHLRQELQAFYDAVAAHEPVPEQAYVFACIVEFLSSVPSENLVQDISTILESFDNFNLAFYAMNQFPNARDRVEWIERCKKLVVSPICNQDDYRLFLTEGISSLRTIRSSLHAQPTPLGYFCFWHSAIVSFFARSPLFDFHAAFMNSIAFITCLSGTSLSIRGALLRILLKDSRSWLVFRGALVLFYSLTAAS